MDALVVEFSIEREPAGGGGRRFAEQGPDADQAFGKVYLAQSASKLLGDPQKLRITVEAVV